MMKSRLILLLVMFLCGVELLYSQTTTVRRLGGNPVQMEGNTSKYILSPRDNAIFIRVKIWGEVVKPGIYDVPSGIDLIELLSSAGGPTMDARLSKVKVIHKVAHSDSIPRIEIVDIEKFVDHGTQSRIPILQPDDTIIVPAKFSSYLKTTLSWAATVVNIAAAYALIVERLERAKAYK